MKWFYLFLFAVVVVTAQEEAAEDYYDDFDTYDYDKLKDEEEKIEADLDKLESKNDEKVKEDINKFIEDLAVDEDNREPKDAGLDPADSKNSPIENEQAKEKADPDDYDWGDDSVAPLPVPDEKSFELKELQLDLNDSDNFDLEDIDEYQFEDNREPKDAGQDPADSKNSPIENEQAKEKADPNDYDWGDDSVAPLPVPGEKSSKEKELQLDLNDNDNFDLEDIDEYQFEDNREPKDAGLDPADSKNSPIENEQAKEKADPDDYDWADDSVAPLPVPDLEIAIDDEKSSEENELQLDLNELENELKKYLDDAVDTSDDAIIQETKNILEETGDSFSNVAEIKTNEEENNDKSKEDAVKAEITKDVDDITFEIIKPDNKIIEETKKILEDTDDAFGSSKDEIKTKEDNLDATREDLAEDKILQSQESIIAGKSKSDNNIVEETLKILKGTDDYFDDTQNDVEEKENIEHGSLEEEDNVEDIRADLHADLKKLFDTLDKLSKDDSADEQHIKDKSEELLFKDGSEELVENNERDYEEVDFDKILEHIANEADSGDDSHAVQALVNDEKNEPNPDDAFEEDAESLSIPLETKTEPIIFLDAIVDKTNTGESIAETNDADIDASIESNETIVIEKEILTENDNENSDEPKSTIDINELNSEELSGLVKQFTDAHSEILDVEDTFNDNTAEHIQLTVNDAVVVTSPNYPDAYPTNSIKDWIFSGDGVGIELNITDFLVNGALGDYLLVKPGGVDDSGHDGIVFTYRLNSERRFRFTDVDRLFVRFESKQGFFGMRGFRFTARMIAALPEDPEPLPPAEPVMQAPHSVHTLHLAVVAPQLQAMRENFRLLLADMAEQYIRENNVDPGLNTTSEVTQITSVSACPVTWPNYELCTAVTYGVSLTYEEGEPMLDEVSLKEMWEVYSVRDPFALRLRQMGVAEFLPPRSVMVGWVLVGSGVLLGVVLLVIVLYRFNCLEDYTRMRDFNDSDSLHNEKRDLDLYPTPHQTLPPLYAEHEYKWPDTEDTTRVDMGGLANRSYARDMYDFESDEEVSQNRGGAVTARDSYARPNSNA